MPNLLLSKVSLKELKNFASKFAHQINLNDIILLKGELGAGKTTFSRFFIQEIFKKNSLKKPTTIKSPTFSILINYNLKKFELNHYDFYRIKNKKEINELDVIENINNNITLIEWPEIFIKHYNVINYYEINFKIINDNLREIRILNKK